MHKKLLSIALAFTMLLSMTACNFSTNITKKAKPEEVLGVLDEIASINLKDITASITVTGSETDSASLIPVACELINESSDISNTLHGTGELVKMRVYNSEDAQVIEGKIPGIDEEIKVVTVDDIMYMPLTMLLSISGSIGGPNLVGMLGQDVINELDGTWYMVESDSESRDDTMLDSIEDVESGLEFNSYKDIVNSDNVNIQMSKSNNSTTGKSTVYTLTISENELKSKLDTLDEISRNAVAGKSLTVTTTIAKYEDNNSYSISENVLIGDFSFVVNITIKPNSTPITVPSSDSIVDDEGLNSLLMMLLIGDMDGDELGDIDIPTEPDTSGDIDIPSDIDILNNDYIGSIKVEATDDSMEDIAIYNTSSIKMDTAGTVVSKYKPQGELDGVDDIGEACSDYIDTIVNAINSLGEFSSDFEIESYSSGSVSVMSEDNHDVKYRLYIAQFDYQTAEIEVDLTESDVDYKTLSDYAKNYLGITISAEDIKAIIDTTKAYQAQSSSDSFSVYIDQDGDTDIKISYYHSEYYQNFTIERTI